MSDYDISSAESINEFAMTLHGKSVSQAVQELPANAYKTTNKGGLGSMIEQYFFKYMPGPNKNHEPDFAEAGLELKVTGVLPNKPSEKLPISYRAKERLVLTMISYINIADETWEDSSLLKKCQLMLILFYLYEKEVVISELKFVLPPLLWRLSENDMEIIKNDWHFIQEKVLIGKAHELSEGDTFYLGACRKGSGGPNERLREQPYSDTPAKARAFSLKPSYVNKMIEAASNIEVEDILIKSPTEASQGIEQKVKEKFSNLENKSIDELADMYGIPKNLSSKSYYHSLTMRILGAKKKYIPEFEKAGITIKTIRLQKSGKPKESMSFPAFKFSDLVNQTWEESALYDTLNKKFFFIVFQYDKQHVLRFKKVMFWNMSYEDRLFAENAWNQTRQAVEESNPEHFPKSSSSPVVHVRPHGRNKKDTYELPNGSTYTKQGFWLNAAYIAEQVE